MGDVINGAFGTSAFRQGPNVPSAASATASAQPPEAGTGAMPPDPITAGMSALSEYWQAAQTAMNKIGVAAGALDSGLVQRLQNDFEQLRQAAAQLQSRITRDSADAAINAWQRDIQLFSQNAEAFTGAVNETISQLPPATQQMIASRTSGRMSLWLLGLAAVAGGALIFGGIYFVNKAMKKNGRKAFAGAKEAR